MKYIELKHKNGPVIRFRLYENNSPATCKAFIDALPFNAKAVQARFAGEEIWIQKGPYLKINQENATILLKPGELGYASPNKKSEIGQSIAIVYGEAKLSGRVNVFAMVFKEDFKKLQKLGEKIWLGGSRVLRFELKEKKKRHESI